MYRRWIDLAICTSEKWYLFSCREVLGQREREGGSVCVGKLIDSSSYLQYLTS